MTLGEILQKALLNTALGMGTVFCMLIFISLVISCFKFIPKDKKPEAAAPARSAAAASKPADSSEEDDIVPAIIAAILASKGISPDSAGDGPAPYIVRSIRRIG